MTTVSVPDVPEVQAHTRADTHIHAAATALGPTVRLQLQSATVEPCDDPTDGGPRGRVFVARRYWLLDADPTRPDAFGHLAAYWSAQGYRVLNDGRAQPYPYLWVEHPDDGYRVGVDRNATGELLLGASSPCFWPTQRG